jgi:phosphoglucosamine mutase
MVYKATQDYTRLFGTSGVRGIVGEDLSLPLCREVGRATGTNLPRESKVCIATDTRVSRETVKNAVISGLRDAGIHVTDLGILPTPVLAFVTRDMGFDTGVMITASHNPPEYNGIKLFNSNSIGYSETQEAEIEKVYDAKRFRAGYTGYLEQSQEAKERYFRFIRGRFSASSFKHNFRIVIDAGNGAASGFVSDLFSVLGLNVIPINYEPDGLFPGRSPEPREDTLHGTVDFLRKHGADLAACFDGDADRVVFCDSEGFLGFDEMTALVSYLAVKKSNKRKVATTVETGRFLDLALDEFGVEVVRGRVGDVSVAYLTQGLDAAIGVEPVGVYIMPEIGYYPDSIFATLTLLSQIEEINEVRDFFKGIPQLFRKQRRIPCPDNYKASVMEKIRDDTALFRGSRLNTLDGLRFEFDNSWILVRPSGTEPLIRIIAESDSGVEMKVLLDEAYQTVENILAGVKA